MDYDPQRNPDFWIRAYVMKDALEEASTIIRPGIRRWLKRAALLALALVLWLFVIR